MIASFSRSFVFIRTRKTASTSTEIALGTVCGPEDIVTPVGVEDELTRRRFGGLPGNFCTDRALETEYREALVGGDEKKITRLYRRIMQALDYHHHMSAAEVKARLPELWARAFKFAVDRHPYEKVVSLAYWRGRAANLTDRAVLDEWIDRLIEEEEYRNSDLYCEGGRVAVDRVLRFEELDRALADVAAELGFTLPELPRSKGQYRSDRRPAAEVLHPRQKERIRATCAFEFDLLGYQA